MVDYVNNYLGPKFEKMHPGVKVARRRHRPRRRRLAEDLREALRAAEGRRDAWDIDVAVVHQRGAGTMVNEKLLEPYRNDVPPASSSRATRRRTRSAPTSTATCCRCSTARSRSPTTPTSSRRRRRPTPSSAEWVKKNPKQFGYNGVKGGMSGVGFVMGWVSAFGGVGDKLEKGPYDAATRRRSTSRSAGLKDFNQNVVMTPGNAGTLDMLNRGEIAMGPVWVDMFYTWQADGKMPPKIKLSLVAPGLPGQPMYYVIPAKAANAALAKKFIDLAASPEVQADGIVKQFNWYPGIDAKHVQASSTRPPGTSSSPTSRRPTCEERPAVPALGLLHRHRRRVREKVAN